ncbi:VanZ family protein [Paenibacillus sp. IHBB 10380]|uniref:VanZ family protein n=1 Tax=Paenibacillus sp. IHBB 10380 TaxID=1566358 RepID=UPI0005CFAB9E|nr:VanZ family protein [Paenibacillus sp. IHBB 10380]
MFRLFIRVMLQTVMLGYSLCLLYWMFIGFGRVRHVGAPLSYNLMPFETISLYVRHHNEVSTSTWFINLFGNVGVFVPFGLLLPILSKRLRSYMRLALLFVPCVIVLEFCQMVLRVGSFDIDDVILNLLGVWIGYFIVKRFL